MRPFILLVWCVRCYAGPKNIDIYIHPCLHACIQACIHNVMHAYIHTDMYVCVHMYIYIYLCVYVCFLCYTGNPERNLRGSVCKHVPACVPKEYMHSPRVSSCKPSAGSPASNVLAAGISGRWCVLLFRAGVRSEEKGKFDVMVLGPSLAELPRPSKGQFADLVPRWRFQL